jgi:serine/threonine protein kinase
VSPVPWPEHWRQVYTFDQCLKSRVDKEVWLATDQRTGWRAILRASRADAPESADAEYRILAGLDRPGIPKVFGSHEADGWFFIARQYFEGEPLDAVITRGLFTPAQTARFAGQLCALLEYLHAQVPPVIHRDIKPGNIIVLPDGSPGLTDFGIARTHKPGADTDTHYSGTLPYAPPEQYGYEQTTPLTDVYSVGILMITLLTGSPDRFGLSKRVLDRGLRAVIEKCIAFNPKDRFRSAADLRKRLTGLRHRRLRVGALAMAVVVALAGTGLWAYSARPWASLLPPAGASASAGGSTPPPASASPSVSASVSDSPTPGFRSGSGTGQGNSCGNLANGGFAVEAEGKVFLRTNQAIHRHDPETGELNLGFAIEDSPPRALNYYDGYLYYATDAGVRKLSTAGGEPETVVAQTEVNHVFVDNGMLYYAAGSEAETLYQADLDGSDPRVVNPASTDYYIIGKSTIGVLAHRCVVDGVEYYRPAEGLVVNARDLATGTVSTIKVGMLYQMSIWDGYLYYSTWNRQGFWRVSLAGGENEKLFDFNTESNVVTADGIFAIRKDETAADGIVRVTDSGETYLGGLYATYIAVAAGQVYSMSSLGGTTVWCRDFSGSEEHELSLW